MTAALPPESPVNTGSVNCLALGTRIKQFHILNVIGEGGFGIVYRAFDESLQRDVALKEYMPGALAGRQPNASVRVRSAQHEGTFRAGLSSFINEARILAKFNHPAMVSVYSFWEENGTAYMAMPFYEGLNLRQAVAANPAIVTEQWIAQLLVPILDVLENLHAMSCYHRDVAPDNILLQQNGKPILLDFGAARRVIGDMTQAMTVILKPGFAPIEQYVDDGTLRQGAWTDIYALSAVLYSLIQGKPPTPSVVRMVNDPMTRLAGSRSDYSPGLLTAIDRGLAVKPEQRPQSIAEFRALLNLPAAVATQQFGQTGFGGANQDQEKTVIVPQQGIDSLIAGSAPEPLVFPPTFTAAETRPIPVPLEAKRPVLLPAVLVLSLTAVLWAAWWWSSGRTPPAVVAQDSAIKQQAVAPPAEPPEPLAKPAASAPVKEEIPGAPTDQPPQPDERAAVPATNTVVDLPGPLPVAAPPKEPGRENPIVKQLEAIAPTGTPGRAESKPEVAAKVAGAGSVALFVQPWGEILVDGKPRGTSPPIKRLTLAPGSYSIELRNPSFPPVKRQVEVRSKETVAIRHQFQ